MISCAEQWRLVPAFFQLSSSRLSRFTVSHPYVIKLELRKIFSRDLEVDYQETGRQRPPHHQQTSRPQSRVQWSQWFLQLVWKDKPLNATEEDRATFTEIISPPCLSWKWSLRGSLFQSGQILPPTACRHRHQLSREPFLPGQAEATAGGEILPPLPPRHQHSHHHRPQGGGGRVRGHPPAGPQGGVPVSPLQSPLWDGLG